MPLQIYDVMRRKVVPFEPREPGRVSMYVCGPTVYGYIHIGNARTLLWFDQVRRYLTYRGFDVTYVGNYTDVDDKIIDRAAAEGVSADEVAQKYSRAFEDDMEALGVDPPDVLCLATQHIPEMISAIEGLIAKRAAYAVGGDVFFSIESFDSYGKLSRRSLDEMRAGERIEPHASKRHPLDFALWKSAKEGEPSWESPWGPGRPGWHIECSVMSTKYLGMGFDIHGGASDLMFPHHENEIAQAEALSGQQPFVRWWMHAGLVQMESTKMSKSLGNVALVRDVRAAYPGEVIRYWALSASYRSQPTFSQAALDDAAQSYDRWRTFHNAARHVLNDRMPRRRRGSRTRTAQDESSTTGSFVDRFIAAMDDDLNSAEAFAAIHELVGEGNKVLERAQRGESEGIERLTELVEEFLELTGVLNLSFDVAPAADGGLVDGLVAYLLELREQARGERRFDRADEIRDRLQDLGVTIEDTPSGPRWRLDAGAGSSDG